jgi:hypothetical protein
MKGRGRSFAFCPFYFDEGGTKTKPQKEAKMELWKAKTSDKKWLIVEVIGWTEESAIAEELRTGVRFAFSWDKFFEQFTRLEPLEIDTSSYKGADLDRIMKKEGEE